MLWVRFYRRVLLTPANRVPLLIGHREIKPGQHNLPFGEIGDTFHQVGTGGRNRANPGGDYKSLWRGFAPAGGQPLKLKIATQRKVNPAKRFKRSGPAFKNDIERIE